MAEQIISPGVFTKENDLSFLPQGVEAIGAAVVGPTTKGPAFHPTICRSYAEYERQFGGMSNDTFVPNTVREYIRSAGAVTVVRVLAGGGYTLTSTTGAPLAVGLEFEGTVASTATIACADGDDATSGQFTEGEYVKVTVADGSVGVFVLSDLSETGASADGAVLIEGSDIGVGTLPSGTAALGTCIAVGVNLNTNSQAVVLNAVKDAMNSTNSPLKGKISGTAVAASDGAQTATFTNQKGIPNHNDEISTTISQFTVTQFTSAGAGNTVLVGVLFPSMTAETADPSLSDSTTTSPSSSMQLGDDAFAITLGGTGVTNTSLSASLNPSNNNYLFKQLGYKASVSKDGAVSYGGTPAYTYLEFKNILTDAVGADYSDVTNAGLSATSSIVLSEINGNIEYNGNGLGYTEKYSYASTPTITSGFTDPGANSTKATKELFSFHTLAHGTQCNTDYKISITNLKSNPDIDGVEQYGSFTVQLRKYNDVDKSPNVLETYNNCNLNPDDGNYIAKKIGDRYSHFNSTLNKLETLGNFNNMSNYIRVEMNDAVEEGSISPKLLPKGFKAVTNPFPVAKLANINTFPSASYESSQVIGGNYSTKGHLGWKFDDKRTDNKNWLKPLTDVTEANGAGAFNLDNHTGHASSGLWLGALSASIDATFAAGPTSDQLKFSVPFQGGDDGIAPWKPRFTGAESTLAAAYESTSANANLFGFDLSGTDKAGYTGYKKALDILSNQDEYDINMLALPGVIKQYHSNVTQAAIDMVEERGDAFYVMDLAGKNTTVNTALSTVSGIDTNYAAVYYPWVKVQGASKPMFVPPSVVVPGAIAKSDQIGQGEWFAPAGLNRGVLGGVIEARLRLNQSERDKLYDAKINPIATFPGINNPCIWGQKTLQSRSTALDRINVRRLLITVKKFIASSSKFLVFEQNTTKTRARFLNIVNPYLEGIQQRQGLFAFRVQMDGSNNTPDVIDRNQLVGGIFLQPTKTAEFIVLDFNILPTGATFDA
jgi:phage tail sheath protein FI